MQRFVILVRSLGLPALLWGGLTGCADFRDLFTAHAEVAAQAGQMELPAKRLSEIMSAAKGAPINQQTANFVSNTWVDYALFAQAAVRGQLPQDSASVAEAVWPELAELRGTHWHDTLMAQRSAVAPTAADSLYHKTDQRLFQHILIGARQDAAPAVKAAARKKAQAALTRIEGGTEFGRVAAQLSEDTGSRPDSGFLPLGPRGRFVDTFEKAAWALGPGEMTRLVESPYGFHIIKRPALPAVRERLSDHLVQRAGARLDSIYMDSLATINDIKVLSSAPATMRKAAEDERGYERSTKPLVTYTGGALTAGEYVRWVRALPPQLTSQLRQAEDSALRQFARVLTQNVLLLRQADSANIKVSPEEWAGLTERYRAQLDSLRTDMGLQGADVTDSTAPLAEREKVAAMKLQDYFDRLIAGKSRLRPLPSALASVLRTRLPHQINNAGVNRAIEIASEIRAQTDSTAPSQAQRALQQAPGPPPVPGMQPAPGGTPVPARPGQASAPTPGGAAASPGTRQP